jgi:hypothetical protein
MKKKPAPGTGYLERTIGFGLTLKPGEIAIVNVRHDDDCPRLRGGECRCVPDIEAVKPLQRRRA